MLGRLCSRLECRSGGKVQEIAQDRKDGNVGVVRNARPDRNEQHFARKMEKIGKFCPEELSVWLPVAHTSSAGGELRDSFGHPHSSVTVNFEAASVCRSDFPSQAVFLCW